MEVAIDNNIYKQASDYAEKQGLNLTTVIEDFLKRFARHSKSTTEQQTPDIILSLLGAGEKTAGEDLNARKAYYDYLENKYK